MGYFVIDDQVREQILDLVKYAENNPFTMDDLLDIYNKAIQPAGDMKEYALYIQDHKLVYTIEEQVPGLVRHFSISYGNGIILPSLGIVSEIIKILGFESELKDCMSVLEDLPNGGKAINVLELIKK